MTNMKSGDILTETLPNGTSFEMVFVEGGNFSMGSTDYNREKPVHQVEVDSFYIGQFLVTQALWLAIMEDNPSFFVGNNRPVEMVTWNDTQIFLQKLNRLTGKDFRLPYEAEWEYAAKGGNLSCGFRYAGSDKLEEVGWYKENSHQETKPVGMKAPNELGLYDMSGNVYEWCEDWYSDEYYQACLEKGVVQNPKGPESGVSRVLRGGYWDFNSEICRPSNRTGIVPGTRFNDIGFRLLWSPQSVGS